MTRWRAQDRRSRPNIFGRLVMSIRVSTPRASDFVRVVTLAFALAASGIPAATLAQSTPFAGMAPASASDLHYRYIGPVGNRVSSIAGVIGDPNIYYAGAASGGIWKTTDGGVHWSPIFDDQPVSSVGALAVATSNPNIVILPAQGHSYGPQQERGVYRTQDGGKTWSRVLFVDENTGAIDVVMHPGNPQILFAAMWQLELPTYGRES